MTIQEATAILGVPPNAPASFRKSAFLEQRTRLEEQSMEALTPGLQERYVEAVQRLEEAYETMELAANQGTLPSLQLPTSRPAHAPSAHPPPTAQASAPAPAPAPEQPPATELDMKKVATAVIILILIVASMGYYFAAYRPHQLALANQAAAARLAEEKASLEAKLKEEQATLLAEEKRKEAAIAAAAATQVAAAAKAQAAARFQPDSYGRWTNTLGLVFVPIPGTTVWFSIWDTRVEDFVSFVQATAYNATNDMWSLHKSGWDKYGDSWKRPGFAQAPICPVVGVSWDDSQAFCRWLTKIEQEKDILDGTQSYRLPTDAEFSAAVGPDDYPWGNTWPPPPNSGNFAGEEAADADWPNYVVLTGYNDGFPRTSPVGSFPPNQFGLYDLTGNAWQWCEDYYKKEMNTQEVRKLIYELDLDGGGHAYRFVRGASWYTFAPLRLKSTFHARDSAKDRFSNIGFRCVLVPGQPTQAPPPAP